MTAVALLLIAFLPSVVAAAPNGAAGKTHSARPIADPATSSPNASVVVFSPSAIGLNNPTGSDWTTEPAGPSTVAVNLTVYDSKGTIVTPNQTYPLHVHVYGAPEGVITPIDQVLTSGTTTTYTTVTFTYSGAAFPNNMELAAWMNDHHSVGASLGTTLFFHNNPPPCTGSSAFNLEVTSTVPNPIQVKAVVGADNPQQKDFTTSTIDTGSLGVLVSKSSLVMSSNVHGPGAPGQKFYNSSGLVFTGHYYLAPVSVKLADNTFVRTNPILVLAIDGVHCHPHYPHCNKREKPDLHYLGVGFDRNSTEAGDLFDSPSQNAFLELTDSQNGTDINQGYILSTSGVTLGITTANSSGFDIVQLDTNSDGVAGDWNPVHGCYQFTSLSGNPQFCGNLLLDVGISEMFIDLLFAERPVGSFPPQSVVSSNLVPDGLKMQIQAGLQDQPAMSYDFCTAQQPVGPAPTYVKWENNSNVFVNTGRRPLLEYNYLFSGQCGQVGFQRNNANPVTSNTTGPTTCKVSQ